MIQVPLDKIIPMEEAIIDISKIIDDVKAQKSLYVITKDGKPHSAIIDIDMLEHLPELDHQGETKPIHEIGQNESYEGIKIEKEEPSPTSQGSSTPGPQVNPTLNEAAPAQSETVPNKAQEDLKDALSEDIGPWSDTNAESKNPQDLDI